MGRRAMVGTAAVEASAWARQKRCEMSNSLLANERLMAYLAGIALAIAWGSVLAGERPTILVLEDEALIALDIEAVLIEAGFNVAMAVSCAEAEAALEQLHPDAVLLDVQLKDGACIAVAKKLVERTIPFVVHTAYLGPERDEVFAHGAAAIQKPSNPGELVAAVRASIKRDTLS
ncbi:response regulator [Mesorhizobium sp. B2-4-13]|nr:response regulator [Mesorhizobium sp. B2-4-13]